jgi:glycosyltransferase involved in cell wall biosynthesis
MNIKKIHQFSPSVHLGDGISNGMFFFQKILKSLGFQSEIYAENIKDDVKELVKNYKSFDMEDEEQIIFIHYSIYYDFAAWIDKLKAKKHIIYHNITPPEFFKDNQYLYEMCEKGIELLPNLASKFEGSIGDSQLNSDDLRKHNFKNIHTIPLLVDVQKVRSFSFNYELFDKISDDFNIIFVGRIAKNKAQHDLIKIADIYRYINPNFKMYIIGGTTDGAYFEELNELINKNQLQKNVIITGKVSNEDLYAYYKSANIFLCMSEHEGFGMPLIEAMLFNIPVLAYDSSNIANTLNKGGVLFKEKSHKYIAATIELIKNNPKLKDELIQTQLNAIKSYEYNTIVKQVVDYLKIFDISCEYEFIEEKEKIQYQFEGSFDSSYSLAMLNRKAALTYEEHFPNTVSLYSTEGFGDFEPNKDFLEKNNKIKKLWEKSKKAIEAKVTFRNLYPPRVTNMKSQFNILNSYGWEESSFPKEYVKSFNQNLSGIIAVSNYVKDVLVNNGVNVPIKVISNPVDHILNTQAKEYKLKTNKKFKFFHISSCFPRKGVDVLLKSFCEAFTNNDDVVLIIKTFPNPHNDVESQIESLKKTLSNMPEVELINKDLEDEYINWLYQNSDALVVPSRGEGFGLPMAEAMLYDLPVITTNFSGQVDFCTAETSWLIDYSFEEAKTHLNLFNSYWVEPSKSELTSILKMFQTLTKDEITKKTKKAKEIVLNNFTWENYFKSTQEFLEELKTQKIFDDKEINLAWVSSYNTKCGIATYSEYLIENIKEPNINLKVYANYDDEILYESVEKNITRCWKDRFDKDNESLINHIINQNSTHAVINFNFGFFSMDNLKEIIEKLNERNIKIIIIFHSVQDVTIKGLESSLSWIKDSLLKVDKILVHNISDLNILKSFGLVENSKLFPHGIKPFQNNEKQKKAIKEKYNLDNKMVIASYGFLLPHKGIKELIQAYKEVTKQKPNTHLLLVNALYPAPVSTEYKNECLDQIKELSLEANVTMINDFLSDDEASIHLSCADLLVMPYKQTQESSSAAVRNSLVTKKPVLCTPSNIFSDVKQIVHFTDSYLPIDMARKIVELIDNPSKLNSKQEIQEKWIEEYNYKNISDILLNHILGR